MNKELEALKILKANAILFDDGTDFGASMLEAINDLDIYLTPPTTEEVCKAIRKDLREQPIKYNKTYKQFYGLYANEEDEIVTLKNDKIIIWRGNYSIETLDMIVRFYKGEKK